MKGKTIEPELIWFGLAWFGLEFVQWHLFDLLLSAAE